MAHRKIIRHPAILIAVGFFIGGVAGFWISHFIESGRPPAERALRFMAVSEEYRALVRQAYTVATEEMEEAAKDRAPGTWAVVLDADETLLSNVPYYLDKAHRDSAGSSLGRTVYQQQAQSPVLPGARAFLARVRELGGRIVVVTNRAYFQANETEENLRAHDLPFDAVLAHPVGFDGTKDPRFASIAAGLKEAGLPPLDVVLYLGDRMKDFPQQDDLLPSGEDDPYSRFGSEFIIFPNTIYGDWTDSLLPQADALFAAETYASAESSSNTLVSDTVSSGALER